MKLKLLAANINEDHIIITGSSGWYHLINYCSANGLLVLGWQHESPPHSIVGVLVHVPIHLGHHSRGSTGYRHNYNDFKNTTVLLILYKQ